MHISEIRSNAEHFDIKQRNLVFLLNFLWERRFLNRRKVITGKDVILSFENGDVVNFDLSHFSDCLTEQLTQEDINKIISKLIKKNVNSKEYEAISKSKINFLNL